jgi:lambda repressor-like predicted transcriptional regulator
MEIADWLEKQCISLRQLSERAGLGASTLYEAFKNKRSLSVSSANRVSQATKGKVSPEEAANANRKPVTQHGNTCKKKKVYCENCGEEVTQTTNFQKKSGSKKGTSKE